MKESIVNMGMRSKESKSNDISSEYTKSVKQKVKILDNENSFGHFRPELSPTQNWSKAKLTFLAYKKCSYIHLSVYRTEGYFTLPG